MENFPKKSQGLIPNPFQNLMETLEYDYTMKVRSRKGVMRKRPPKKLLAFFTLMASLPWLANGNPCEFDKFLQCNNTNCSCVKCLMCPPGQGLNPQCGSITLNETVTMKCLPCKDGTFSNQNDFGSCHPCHLCDGEILQKCNATQNAVCKEGCMAGYKWDEFSNMCEPMNPQKSTPTKLPTELKTIQSVPTSVKSLNPPYKHKQMSNTEIAFFVFIGVILLFLLVFGYWKKEKIVRFLCHIYCSCRGRSQTDQQDPVETAPMNLAAAEEDVELNDIRVEYTDRSRGDKDTKERNSRASGQQGDSPGGSTPSTTDPQPKQGFKEAISDHSGSQGWTVEKAIEMFDNPDHDGLRLTDLSFELKAAISVQICYEHQPGWKEIGEFYKIPQQKLKEFETRCTYSSGKVLSGEYLIESLETERPELTVKDFLLVLRAIKRNDIIRYICEKHFNS